MTVQVFSLLEELHHYYQMPVLHEPEVQHLAVRSEVYNIFSFDMLSEDICLQTIQFMINVQHDCRIAGCSATGFHRQRQEHMDLDSTISCIKHIQDERYIINTHALHNAARLQCYLTVPQPIIPERSKWHAEIAAEMRISQAAKQAQSKAQAASTRQKKKEQRKQTCTEFEGSWNEQTRR